MIVDNIYGRQIFRNAKYVVRLQETDDEVTLVLHKITDGVEQHPNGYVIGSNYLTTLKWT